MIHITVGAHLAGFPHFQPFFGVRRLNVQLKGGRIVEKVESDLKLFDKQKVDLSVDELYA